ncbi:DUF5615 family PIN-like protein [Urbifossiella limnaea]|uniref:DUF5615 family PIN-like protein n=1 Tax=Urbifossiella limnaea TaxID=2528023 RepID=UPI0011A822B6|nr:DUF5615 family PIN-like protein [Urbifossiella limnaea]
MASDLRYFFDEHIANDAADALRADGADVLTIAEAGRASMPDPDQLRFATEDGRVVVTHDDDFLSHAADFLAAGEEFAGVAYCHQLKYQNNVRGLINALLLVNGVLTADDMRNHVEFL